jgi:hypothetical protein
VLSHIVRRQESWRRRSLGDNLLKADTLLSPSRRDSDEEEELRLDYEHHDLFPGLPSLTASADAGCSFCDALREATMSLTLLPTCLHQVPSSLRLEAAAFRADGVAHALCRREHC